MKESAAEAMNGKRSSVVVGEARGMKDSWLARHLVTNSIASSGRRSTTTKPSAPGRERGVLPIGDKRDDHDTQIS